MKKKVEILIEKEKYCESVKNGKEFVSVGFSASRYGRGSPCDNEQEIKNAIKSCMEWIRKEGDIPIIKDLRIRQQTLN